MTDPRTDAIAREAARLMDSSRAATIGEGVVQFFIVFARAKHLDGQYTVWGQVVEGMDYVDRIKKGDSRSNGAVDDPDIIVRMQVAADVAE